MSLLAQHGMLMAAGSAPPVGTISYIGSSPSAATTSGTSVTVSVPSGVAIGDLMVAVVMRRSAAVAPSGWALVTSSPMATDSGTDQWTDVWSRKVQSGDPSSFTFSQSGTGRIQGVMAAYRSTTDFAIVDKNSIISSGPVSPNAFPIAPLTATSNGYALAAVSAISIIDGLISASSGWTLVGTGTVVTGLRLGAMTRAVAPGALSGSISIGGGGSTSTAFTKNTIVISAT